MARKKKSQVDSPNETSQEKPDYNVKSEAQPPKRDMSEENQGIKDHAKFDKFKKGNE